MKTIRTNKGNGILVRMEEWPEYWNYLWVKGLPEDLPVGTHIIVSPLKFKIVERRSCKKQKDEYVVVELADVVKEGIRTPPYAFRLELVEEMYEKEKNKSY